MSDRDGAVLVTGATGFIGREIVRRLVGSGRRVIALARRGAGLSAAARVRAVVGAIPKRARLTVLEHDLTRGELSAADRGWLGGAVETVIHAAGDTRFVPTDPDEFRAVHVDGPATLLAALAGGRLERFAHVSTAYVCGCRGGCVLEHEGDVGQRFHNPYERAKLDGEEALRRAASARRVDLRVLRPSIVVGEAPPTAGGAPSNLFFDFVRVLSWAATLGGDRARRLRVPGAPAAPFNVVALAYVVEATVVLADHPAARGGTFHLVTSEAPTQGEMLAMLADVLGLSGARVVEPSLMTHDVSALEARLLRLLAAYSDYLSQDVRFDDRETRRVLDAAGVAPATLGVDDVARLVRSALATAGATR